MTNPFIPSSSTHALHEEIEKLRRRVVELERKTVGSVTAVVLKSQPDGTVLRFDKRFGSLAGSTSTYTYAAIKKNRSWYLTGAGGRSSEDLAEFLTGVTNIEKCTGWETLR